MSVTPCMGWEMLVCMSQAPPPRSSSSLTAKNKGEIPSPTACKNPPRLCSTAILPPQEFSVEAKKKGEIPEVPRGFYTSPGKKGTFGFNKFTLSERQGHKVRTLLRARCPPCPPKVGIRHPPHSISLLFLKRGHTYRLLPPIASTSAPA